MKPYELLDHTADAKFRAYGKTREEAFANAVKGMTAIVTDPEQVQHVKEFTVNVQADDLKKLLFDFLDRTLFLVDTEHFLAAEAKNLTITEANEYTLTATLVGDDVKKYGANLKAVTYSDMLIEEQDNNWLVQVVVDI